MPKKKNKDRYNVYLDKESVDIVKGFLQGTGLNLSSYLDLMTCIAADRILDFYYMLEMDNLDDPDFDPEKPYYNILTAHRVLNLTDSKLTKTRLSQSQIKKLISGQWHIELDEEYGIIIRMFEKETKGK